MNELSSTNVFLLCWKWDANLNLKHSSVSTKTMNDLKPPKTTYNQLQPSTTTSEISTTTYNHLKNIYNHSQTI